MRTKTIILGGLATLSIFNFAYAQYIGPSNQPNYLSVSDVNKQPVNDANVVFQGYLLKQVGNDKYIFSDGTDEIKVDIDNEIFPKVPVDAKTRVEIRGEVEKDFLESPEIDVNVIKVVDK